MSTHNSEQGIGLRVGDKLRDNDPRMGHARVLTVTKILPNGVVAVDGLGKARVYLRRFIHTDGKPRRSGLSRIDQ